MPEAPRTPRPYQTKAIADLRIAMRQHKRVLLQLPTGAGKTFIASTVAKGAAGKGKRVVFLVHRAELLDQTSRTFTEEGIDHGLIIAGEPTPDAQVLVAMVQTLARRLDKVPTPDLVFCDEAHHAVAGTWSRIMAAWPEAYAVGLTATPERLDGRGLGDVFAHMVQGPTVAELITQGYLSKYKAFAPSNLDLAGVRTRMGEYDNEDVSAIIDKPAIIGDIIEHYKRLAMGKRAILFATNVKHSENLVAAFKAAGISAAHVDGETPKELRKQLVADFVSGAIQVLSNCELFGEGFDVPAVEVVILARPTQSLGLYLQQVGRALRPSQGKEYAIVLDHVGNISRHGLPDDHREWSLESQARRQRKNEPIGPVVKQCPVCFCCHRPTSICPECGHQYAPMVQELETKAGILHEVERPEDWAYGINLVTARGRDWACLLEAAGANETRLRQIARARGFKRGWVQHRLQELEVAA